MVFDLSRVCGDRFFYLANREGFDRMGGVFGWVLQRMGAYSIVRGTIDRESFRMSRKLLSQGANRLVTFPEGEDYSQNDSLLPFHTGVFQIAFGALQDMGGTRAVGSDEPDADMTARIPPLFIVPIAIRYRYVGNLSHEFAKSMNRLEHALALKAPAPSDSYQRLRRIADAVITSAERSYGLERGGSEDLNPRLDAVRQAMVLRVSTSLGMDPARLGDSWADKMRSLSNAVYAVTREELAPESLYQVRLILEERSHVRPLLLDLERLANWVAVRDQYVGESPSQERMAETLLHIEVEVLGKRLLRGKRQCYVRVGEAIDLRQYREQYESDRKGTVAQVTSRVESAVLEMLRAMASPEASHSAGAEGGTPSSQA